MTDTESSEAWAREVLERHTPFKHEPRCERCPQSKHGDWCLHCNWCTRRLFPCETVIGARHVLALTEALTIAVGQARMWYERDWYDSAALEAMAEEIDGEIYGNDIADRVAFFKRGIAPVTPLERIELAAAALAGEAQ